MKKKHLNLFLLVVIVFFNVYQLKSNDSLLLDFYLTEQFIKTKCKNIRIIEEKVYNFSNNEWISNTITQYNGLGLQLSKVYNSTDIHSIISYIYGKLSDDDYSVSINSVRYRNNPTTFEYSTIYSKNLEYSIFVEDDKLVSNGIHLTEIVKKENTIEIKQYEKCYLLFDCLIAKEDYDSLYRPIYKNYINSNMIYNYTYKGDTTYMDIDFERSPLRNGDQFIVNTKTVKVSKNEKRVYEEETFYPDIYKLSEINLLNSFGQDSITYDIKEKDDGALDTLTVRKYYYEFYNQ